MAFSVPDLPYDYNALEPHIDEETMRIHHDKHHQAYVDKANAALEGTEWADKDVEEVVANLSDLPADKQGPVRNNAGGHANHSFFWQVMSPDGGGEPSGDLADGDQLDLRQFRRVQGSAQERRNRSVWLRLGVAGPQRQRPRGHLDRQSGLTPDSTARRRFWVSTSGSTPITSTTRTSALITWTPSGT